MENTQENGLSPKEAAVKTQAGGGQEKPGSKAFKKAPGVKPGQKAKAVKGKRRSSLAGRISALVCVSMLVVFVLANIVLLKAVGKSFDKINQDYLLSTTAMNVEKARKSITLAENAARAISEHLDEMYNETDNGAATVPSLLKDTVHLSERRSFEEKYLLDSVWEMIRHDEHIMGAGVFFEPNAFQQGEPEYAMYLGRDNGDENKRFYKFLDYKFYGNGAEEYYTKASQEKVSHVVDPFVSSITGETIFVLVVPILHNDQFMGTVVVDLNVKMFDSLGKDKSGEGAKTFFDVINKDGKFVYSSNPDAVGKNLAEYVGEETFKNDIQSKFDGESIFHIQDGHRIRYFAPLTIYGTDWYVQSAMSLDLYNQGKNQLFVALAVAEVVLFILLQVILFTALKKSLSPLGKLAEESDKLAEGNFDIKVSYAQEDEIGRLVKSFNNIVKRLTYVVSDLQAKLGAFAQGDFGSEIKEDENYKGDFRPILNSLQEISTSLNSTLKNVHTSSSEVSSSAEQVSSMAQRISEGTTKQASSIAELSKTMEDITEQIRHTTKQAEKAQQLGVVSGSHVETSNQKMTDMQGAMEEITEKSKEISKIIKTIDDIAFQTNILSLNAAIEAARAGAAGKGFAVVADEVGNLAQKSAKAAQNTGLLIEETIEAVEKGAKITEETAESLNSVSKSTEEVNTLIEKISSASSKDLEGITSLNQGLQQISSVVQANSATAEQSAAASEELTGQANKMNELVERFQLKEE
ncbi:MAG: HAMP domain-containing protein [Oribacterium sinus]|uniref:HAMP domain-containing protein n=1 Tax=Oribacterium sinus TaxID=237576 RepID=A0A930DVN3_9FIRM|nr:HAMP domain-containing protein [Oribacterium sinus]